MGVPGQSWLSLAPSQRRCFCTGEEDEANSTEAFWRRRYRKVKRDRARMHQQVAAAHDQLRIFHELGRRQMVAANRLSSEDARKFASIDERLYALQLNPEQLEYFDRKKQFHNDWWAKKFNL